MFHKAYEKQKKGMFLLLNRHSSISSNFCIVFFFFCHLFSETSLSTYEIKIVVCWSTIKTTCCLKMRVGWAHGNRKSSASPAEQMSLTPLLSCSSTCWDIAMPCGRFKVIIPENKSHWDLLCERKGYYLGAEDHTPTLLRPPVNDSTTVFSNSR